MSSPLIYLFSQWIIGAQRSRLICVNEYVRPLAGHRILDVGCGPGYVRGYLPETDYVGFDTDKDHIDYAKRKYAGRGLFYCQELDDAAAEKLQPFDLIMMNGLLHHLDDAQAVGLLRRAKRLLKPGGKIVTLDGCYVPGQSIVAKILLDHDRGEHVRGQKGYEDLIAQVFSSHAAHVRHDMMFLPYTLIVTVLS